MSMENINNASKLHFVLVPLMAQGHMIPMVDVARLLSDRGAQVSFITTPVNATRVKPVLSASKSIRIVELTFPCKEFGLPEGCENVDLISSGEHYKPFFYAASTLGEQLKLYIKEQTPAVTCIISDYCNYFTAEVGQSLNVPRIIFPVPSCLFIYATHVMRERNSFDGVGGFDPVAVPDLPKKIEISKVNAGGWFTEGWDDLRAKAVEAEATALGVILNTCYELESDIINRYEELIGKRVWSIGPLCIYDKDDIGSKANRGNKSSVDETLVTDWLDAKDPKSVVYVSFGTLVRSKTAQLIEIGKGLENSNAPFVWVIKETERSREFDEWMSEGGFEERTKGRGLVITGWAPQVVILAHGSVGGFLTHAGWNSVLEATCAGVPMLTAPSGGPCFLLPQPKIENLVTLYKWVAPAHGLGILPTGPALTAPLFADHFLNEKLVVEIIGTGVAVGVEKPHHYFLEDEVPVRSEAVAKAVVQLMDKGEEGDARRRRAAEYGERARKAMEQGGSSWKNLTDFMEFISQV